MNGQSGVIETLREAGWEMARRGRRHQIWRCPCGQHQMVLSSPKARRSRDPYLAESIIKRCTPQSA